MVRVFLRPEDPRDILAWKGEVEYEDIHHFKYTYRMCHDWYKEEKYVDIDGYGDKVEQLYWERGKPEGGSEHHIWWRAIKEVNSYVRYFLKLNYQTLYHKPHSVVHQGQKMKTNIANSIYRIEMWVQLDYKNQWAKHWFLRHVDRIFRERIYHDKWWMHRHEAYKDAIELTNKIKRALGFKTPVTMPKSFRSEKMIS